MSIVIIHQYAADVNYCLPDIAAQVYIYIIHIGGKFVKYLTKIFEKQERIKTGIKDTLYACFYLSFNYSPQAKP